MDFREAVIAAGFDNAAPAGGKPMHEALLGVGASPQRIGPADVVAAEWRTEISPAQVLDGIRSRDNAASGVLPDEILGAVSRKLDQFVAAQWAEATKPQTVLRRFVISTHRLYSTGRRAARNSEHRYGRAGGGPGGRAAAAQTGGSGSLGKS